MPKHYRCRRHGTTPTLPFYAGERGAIVTALDRLRVAVNGFDRAELRTDREQLNRANREFTARHMDSAVRQVLAGQRFAELKT